MLCLSLHQPWASLFAHGKKRIETRSWHLPAGKPLPCVLAVHAAKKWNGDLVRIAHSEPFYGTLTDLGYGGGRSMGLPLGFVIGLVRLKECVGTARVAATAVDEVPFWSGSPNNQYLHVGPTERAFGDYTPGRWGWVTDACRPLPTPVACVGRQGLFNWEPDAEARDLAAELEGVTL